jgi:cbb3-type cytochrome oxidase subunit 3
MENENGTVFEWLVLNVIFLLIIASAFKAGARCERAYGPAIREEIAKEKTP